MIGSLMIDVAGTQLSPTDKQLLQHPQVGGVILFSRNVVSAEQTRALCDSIRSVRAELLIAVDQEGGRVRRLRQGYTELPSMGALGALYQRNPKAALELCYSTAVVLASEVLASGFDFSFAPVLDLGGVSQVIGDRAFSNQPLEVVELAGHLLNGFHAVGMAATGKHFPGHGGCAPDSHLSEAVDQRSKQQILQHDTLVFQRLLHKLAAVMPGHVIYPEVDSKPAGFSKLWLEQILKQQLEFGGAVISDDLSMNGACSAGAPKDRVQTALAAGCDLVLVCNNRDSALSCVEALEQANQPPPNQQVLTNMKAKLPEWRGSLEATCAQISGYSEAKANLKTLVLLGAEGVDPTEPNRC